MGKPTEKMPLPVDYTPCDNQRHFAILKELLFEGTAGCELQHRPQTRSQNKLKSKQTYTWESLYLSTEYPALHYYPLLPVRTADMTDIAATEFFQVVYQTRNEAFL